MLMRTREGATTFLTQHGPFSPHVASRTRIDLVVYIYKKNLHFFKYYLKILIRMAKHTRAKTELRHGRPNLWNLLQSVINTAKRLGMASQMQQYLIRFALYVGLYYVFNYMGLIFNLYSTFNTLFNIQLRIQHSTIHFIFNSLFTHSIIYSTISTIYSTFNFNY